MSDPRGPISAVVGPAGEALARHQSLPPDQKNANLAYGGGFIVGVSGYVALTLRPYAAYYPQEWKLGLAGVACFGLLLLVVGWRGSRGRRNPVGAFFALAVPLGGYFAVKTYFPELLTMFYARAFLAGVIVANAVRFWIDVRGPGGGNAQRMVQRQIENMATPMKPGRPRKF